MIIQMGILQRRKRHMYASLARSKQLKITIPGEWPTPSVRSLSYAHRTLTYARGGDKKGHFPCVSTHARHRPFINYGFERQQRRRLRESQIHFRRCEGRFLTTCARLRVPLPKRRGQIIKEGKKEGEGEWALCHLQA